MWQKFPAFIREWPILIVAILLIVPVLYFSSYDASSSKSTASALSLSRNGEPAGRPTVAHAPAPSVEQSSPPAPTPAKIAPNSAQAPAKAPSHDRMAAAPSAQTSGQGTPAPAAAIAPAIGDVATGKLVFRKCQACHSLEPGKNGLGPSLAGVIGKKASGVPNYNYSPAMKGSNLTWDAATLDAYLSDPQKLVPGNKMPFPGLKTENERNAVIAFLASTSVPGPAAPPPAAARAPAAATPPASANQPASSYVPGLRYTLRTGIAEGRMVFIGVGGAIDGQVNPLLSAAEGQGVQVTLINGEGAEHDIVFADQEATARSAHITGKGASTDIAFRAGKAGDYIYFCSLPGHQLAGMQGQFLVTPQAPPQTLVEADISKLSTDLPPPIAKRTPQTIRVDLTTVELEGRLAEGTTFGYWTFDGKVPGPFLRVRVGDTVDVRLKNSGDSAMVHSVDFHAATGPGGGAAATQTNPGEETSVKFKALIPGLYVYHCATPMVAHHIANGMYGLIGARRRVAAG